MNNKIHLILSTSREPSKKQQRYSEKAVNLDSYNLISDMDHGLGLPFSFLLIWKIRKVFSHFARVQRGYNH